MNINSEASGSVSNTNSSTSIKYNLHSPEWFNVICEQVVKDMNTYGLCVIDNFLGASRGDRIYNEVKSMFSHGLFKDGELVNKRSIESKTIRGDKIIWINGTEPYCPNIGFLMRTLDAILLQCNNMEDNGCFGKYKLTSRTKAMLACYPGCGTHYVKHVDNPNEDGREITGIYYLNKNWNVERDGGMLRMFPLGCDHIADIEPIFDRLLFFWSDRRNPHEVQPSFSVRFAITVWYFNNVEKKQITC